MHLKYCNLTISYQGRLLLMTSEECSTCARYTLVPARSAPCVLTHFFTIFQILITYTSVPHHELEASQRVQTTQWSTLIPLLTLITPEDFAAGCSYWFICTQDNWKSFDGLWVIFQSQSILHLHENRYWELSIIWQAPTLTKISDQKIEQFSQVATGIDNNTSSWGKVQQSHSTIKAAGPRI